LRLKPTSISDIEGFNLFIQPVKEQVRQQKNRTPEEGLDNFEMKEDIGLVWETRIHIQNFADIKTLTALRQSTFPLNSSGGSDYDGKNRPE
jgi:hypothetical protein